MTRAFNAGRLRGYLELWCALLLCAAIVTVWPAVPTLTRLRLHIGAARPVATAQPQPAALVTSSPVALGGVCQANVIAALNASGGALRHVEIQPGQTWSFNATVGNPERIVVYWCAGVPGGGWCNLAAAYSQTARRLGLTPQFVDHGFDLGYGRDNAVAIWNIDGSAGFSDGAQDLLLANTTPYTIILTAQDDSSGVVVEGSVLQ